MVTSVTRSNHFSGTDSQGGDELDQTVNCSKATYRRPLYLRGYTETQKGRLMILWKGCFHAHYTKTTISFIEKKKECVFAPHRNILYLGKTLTKPWVNHIDTLK